MYRLGLDIGTTSVGWAVLNTNNEAEPDRIIDLGVRIFDAAENPKDGSSLAAPRRIARGARRRNRRHQHRMERIKALIINAGILTGEELSQLYEKKNLSDIYQIRYEALDRLLTDEELARVLIHIAQRRGFKSNRKNEDKKSDNGKLLTATNENSEYMASKGYRTVGEMLYLDIKFKNSKRNKGGDYSNTFLRSQIAEEVEAIFARQRQHGNKHISDSLLEKYNSILLSQRDFDQGPGKGSPYAGDQIEKMVGICTFEKDEKRAAKATYTFEYFNLLQKINAIRIQSGTGKRPLSAHEKNIIVELCHKTENVEYRHIRKELSIGSDEQFANLSYGDKSVEEIERTKFKYLNAYHDMRKAFDKLSKGYILNISVEKRDAIATALTYYKTDEKILSRLDTYEFTDEEKNVILELKNYSKFGNLSLKALKKITPYLEQGNTYDKACVLAGYDFHAHTNSSRRKYLPKLPEDTYEITSPVVKRAVNQTIKVINEIIRRYGSPAAVNIELAREMSRSFEDRKDIEKAQKENADNNQKIYEEIKSTFKILAPSGQDIIKYRLWKEQQETCLYTNSPIKAELLFSPGYCEIDHIIPYSISFDDSYSNKALVLAYANREKGNRLPMQYVKSKSDFIGLVNAFIKNKAKKNKLLKESISPEDEGQLKQRSLQDTQFITRFMLNYIRDNLEFDSAYKGKIKVQAVNGAVTSYMRKRWGISKFREDTDKHHCVDATVVACITPGIIQRVTKYSKQRENYYVDRDIRFNNEKFPLPWPEFKKELDARTIANPQRLLAEMNLANYIGVDIEKIRPVFVSRMTRKKTTGQAHKETVRAWRDVTVNGVTEKKTVTKTALQDLKLDKNNEILNYYNPSSDRLLYELLRDRLIAAGGNGKKAFAEGYVLKPAVKGGASPKVKKVKIYDTSNLNVPINEGVAANGDMVRIDLYKVEGDGYYFVPVYVSDLIKDKLPAKASVQAKPYSEWKEMKEEDFLWSVYPNDLLYIEHKKDMKFTKVFKDAKIDAEMLINKAFVYYNSADISTASIKVITDDNSYMIRGLGIKTITNIQKYHVDVLGNKYKAEKESRK